MNPQRHAALPTANDPEQDAATRWPLFSEQEWNRLRFLAYRRETGRIRPPAPMSTEIDDLCVVLLAGLVQPTSEPPQTAVAAPRITPRSPRHARGGVPLTWAAWAAKYGTLRPDRGARRPHPYEG